MDTKSNALELWSPRIRDVGRGKWIRKVMLLNFGRLVREVIPVLTVQMHEFSDCSDELFVPFGGL